jgi:alkanesulfonate monooxygenase SsuD/methylene tetrahydromethanopterin reductase-like flavin-dependent oxidoreductase (luciferase family)
MGPLGIAVSVLGALSSASAERRAANFNAAAAERDAAVARQNAAADAQAQSREARRRIGAARAAYGAAGVALEGSPLDVLEQSAAEAEMDKLNILYKGELQAMGYDDSAALSRSRAKDATTAGLFRAGSTVLTGAAKGAFGQSLKIG